MSEELFHQDEQVSEVLQQVSSQLRLSLGNIHSALARLAPPDVRDGEEKTDLNAAVLSQSYYQKQALDALAIRRDDVAVLPAAEVQLDAHQLRGHLGPFHDGPAELDDVLVHQPRALGTLRLGGVGQIIGQAEDPVIALRQHRRVQIGLLFPVPDIRGNFDKFLI